MANYKPDDPLHSLQGMVEAEEYGGTYYHTKSKMKAPTLCDALIREYMRPFYRELANVDSIIKPLRESRKFVLDDDMSAFMADLSYASLLQSHDVYKAKLLLEGMRMGARLPHKVTWIEYNHFRRSKRAVEEYGAALDISAGALPERAGWLCIQHPEEETSFMAMHAVSDSFAKDDPTRMIGQPGMMIIAYVWRSDDGVLPWPQYDLDIPWERFVKSVNGEVTPAGILTGVNNYKSDKVGLIRNRQLKDVVLRHHLKHGHFNPVAEVAGDLRYLWALLCTINDLPTSMTEVRATKGFVARGAYRKFQDHKVIHLHVPEKQYRHKAVKAIAYAKRRAHQVRAHFRVDYRHPLSALCDAAPAHEFVPIGQKVLECRVCKGRKLHVKEHMRGDPAFGVVTHDYVVEHPHDDDKE